MYFNDYNALNKMPFDKMSLGQVLLDEFSLGEVSFECHSNVHFWVNCLY